VKNTSYMVIEYAPSLLDNREFAPVRMDGHYAEREAAERIASLWAKSPTSEDTRIVAVEVVTVAKEPSYRK
jgi:hypothetical protein